MKEKIIVDIGSGSIKAYIVNEDKEIKPIYKKTIMFKVNFSKEKGILEKDKNKLIDALQEIKTKYDGIPVYAYATSIFRLMTENQVKELTNLIYEKTEITINIVTKEQESIYMAKAVGNIEGLDDPYLVFSVGGSSTEFIVLEKGNVKENFTVEFAVGDVLKEFPDTANDITKVTFNQIYEYISKNLTQLPKTKCKYAIFTGLHLTYNKVAGNKMEDNDIFIKKNIPKYITSEKYKNYTINTIEKRNLKELKDNYPQDPKFMDGARASVSIITYILEKTGAEYIFPTDLNMIDGIVNEIFDDIDKMKA